MKIEKKKEKTRDRKHTSTVVKYSKTFKKVHGCHTYDTLYRVPCLVSEVLVSLDPKAGYS